jgi:hypothetical protein
VLGNTKDHPSQDKPKTPESVDLVSLSPEELGDIEYRALQVLLKVTPGKIKPMIKLSNHGRQLKSCPHAEQHDNLPRYHLAHASDVISCFHRELLLPLFSAINYLDAL